MLQQIIRPRRQLGILRDDAEPLLVGEDLLAQRVPALVEQMHVADLLDPFRRRVVRRVRCRPARSRRRTAARVDRVDVIHPRNGIVRHGGGQVPARLADVGIDRGGVAEEVRLPLAGVATDESVEVFEAHADRPLIERPGLARLKGGVLWSLPNHDVRSHSP